MAVERFWEAIRSLPERDDRVRWDIQGLRALAVAAVVGDHLFAWPHGGFVGVDIFFVISGFLITGILVRQHEKTGHISWLWFYRRRVRRIIPAAVLVLLATVVAARFFFNTVRFHETVTDAVWAFCFAANWRFYDIQTNYFTAHGPTSPLQHYWSLSVEEQFYFVWPWLLLLVFALLLGRGRSHSVGRAAAGVVIAAVTVGSFLYAVQQTRTDVAGAYFSSLTRVWELGVGATLALAVPLCRHIPRLLRPVLAWVGLASMLASLWYVDSNHAFPAPAAAWPVLSTALVIAAGTGTDQQRFFWVLTNRPVNYLGDISYSLYLWHFPVIIIGESRWGDTARVRVELLLAMLLVSVFAFHLVEDPIRRSRWLEPDQRYWLPTRIWRSARRGELLTTQQRAGWLGVVALVTLALVASQLQRPSAPHGFAVHPDANPTHHKHLRQTEPRQAALTNQIVHALQATTWPELHPSMDSVIGAPPTTSDLTDCGYIDNPIDVSGCTFGDPSAKHRAVVLGDSISMTYAGVLRTVIERRPGWSLTSLGGFGCPFVTNLDSFDLGGKSLNSCVSRDEEAVSAVDSIKPDIIFLVQVSRPHTDGSPTSPAEWTQVEADELAKLGGHGRLVILTAPPSDGTTPAECYTPGSSPSDCVTQVNSLWVGRQVAEQVLAQQLHGVFVDTRDWFCADGACPAFVGTTPTRVDEGHFTTQYGQKIVPVAEETLTREGVFKGF